MPYTREEIYEYKGWSLVFIDYSGVRHIEWGTHEGCGSAGLYASWIAPHNLHCANCNWCMPEDVYVHLHDAMELLKSTLCSPD